MKRNWLTVCESAFGLVITAGGAKVGELSVGATEVVDHGEDEFFDLLGLDLSLGKEFGGAEAELGHVLLGDFAAGVDDQRESVQGRLIAEPLERGRSRVAVGEG